VYVCVRACLFVCDLETSTIRRYRPELVCYMTEQKCFQAVCTCCFGNDILEVRYSDGSEKGKVIGRRRSIQQWTKVIIYGWSLLMFVFAEPHYDENLVTNWGMTLDGNLEHKVWRAELSACSAKWNMSNKPEAFALGPSKLTQILDSFGRSHVPPDSYQILSSSPTFTSVNPAEFLKLRFIWIIRRCLVCTIKESSSRCSLNFSIAYRRGQLLGDISC